MPVGGSAVRGDSGSPPAGGFGRAGLGTVGGTGGRTFDTVGRAGSVTVLTTGTGAGLVTVVPNEGGGSGACGSGGTVPVESGGNVVAVRSGGDVGDVGMVVATPVDALEAAGSNAAKRPSAPALSMVAQKITRLTTLLAL